MASRLVSKGNKSCVLAVRIHRNQSRCSRPCSLGEKRERKSEKNRNYPHFSKSRPPRENEASEGRTPLKNETVNPRARERPFPAGPLRGPAEKIFGGSPLKWCDFPSLLVRFFPIFAPGSPVSGPGCLVETCESCGIPAGPLKLGMVGIGSVQRAFWSIHGASRCEDLTWCIQVAPVTCRPSRVSATFARAVDQASMLCGRVPRAILDGASLASLILADASDEKCEFWLH
jgi:hypothetical protein